MFSAKILLRLFSGNENNVQRVGILCRADHRIRPLHLPSIRRMVFMKKVMVFILMFSLGFPLCLVQIDGTAAQGEETSKETIVFETTRSFIVRAGPSC